MKKILIMTFGLCGVLLFGSLLILTFTNHVSIEKSGKFFLELKLKSEVNKKIDSMVGLHRNLAEFGNILKNSSSEIVDTQISKMSDQNGECRQKWQERLNVHLKFETYSIEKAKEKLVDFARGKYMETVEKLMLDIRIFLAANLLVFVFLLIVSFFKAQTIKRLYMPSLLLLVSVVVCSYFYVFEQNWFYIIIYGDYIGFWYFAYLVGVFAFLCDIAFNKARVTDFVMDMVGNVFSSPSC